MDLVNSVTKVVEIAIQIKELVEKVHQNKEDCRNMATRVERLRAVVENLANTAVSRDKTMIGTLNEFEVTFLRALKLVKACQTKNTVWLFLTAGNVSKQLGQVNDEILKHIHEVILGSVIHNNLMLTEIYKIDPEAKPKPKKLLKVQSMQGEQEIQVVGGHFVLQDTDISDVPREGKAAHSSYATDSRSEVHGEKENFPAGSLEDTISSFRNFTSSELKAVTNNFSDKHVIGKGGSAIVYKGVFPNGPEVAIKSFCVDDSQDENVARYAEVFSVLREHENIVKFLGYCHEVKLQMVPVEGKCVAVERRHMLVVEEYMPNGTLSEIVDGSSQQLDWSTAFRIIRGIAQGVAHIHTKGVVHLDLKPANIILDFEMNPKICDFERSKILHQNDEEVADKRVTKEFAGTLGYLPLEYMADGILSFKHDVFSFGILLLHTINKSGFLPDSTDWTGRALEGQDGDGLLGSSSRDESELKEIKRCMDIGMQCSAKERTDRPTIWDVVDMLDGKKQPRSSFKSKNNSRGSLRWI